MELVHDYRSTMRCVMSSCQWPMGTMCASSLMARPDQGRRTPWRCVCECGERRKR